MRHVAKGPNLIVLAAALAATLTQTDVPAQSTAPAAPAAAAAPVDAVPPPAEPAPSPITAPAAAAPGVATPPPVDPATPTADIPAKRPAYGEIVVSGESKMKTIDPIEDVNKVSFQAIESVDKALIGPIMHIYRDGIPRPIRMGLHNFFFNLTEPVNALNHVLQLHPGRALKTLERFGINSTIGIAGLVDVAKKKPFNIHYRPNGFGNTFGYWGIGPGPYLFLPLVGPTSVRDLVGSLLDQAALPLVVKQLKNYYYVTAAGVITELDYRVDIDAGVERVRKTGNVYASYRQAYFRSRFEEIEALHGRGPLARGEVGQPPFVSPLYPEPGAAPAGAPPGANLVPVPSAPPSAAAAPLPATPPPPVFISQPVIQPHPVVQPLPSGYRPGGS
jgi:phospholipid-binding lipoprotein MlaA